MLISYTPEPLTRAPEAKPLRRKKSGVIDYDQLRAFRAWYERFDSDAWDEQIEKDAAGGKCDALAEAATADHKAGKSKNL